MHSEAVGDYLKGIYKLTSVEHEALGSAPLPRAGTQQLANLLGVSPASVTRMLQRLAGMGLVDLETYQGARLTREGEREALEVIRHHRLIERYLHEALNYPWDEVHQEADKLEHYISENFEARIAAVLGNPGVDPHGESIPTAEGAMPRSPFPALASLDEGVEVTIERVPGSSPDKLRYLKRIGLVPGTRARVVERYPFGGGLRLKMEDGVSDVVIGDELASELEVRVEKAAVHE